MEQTVQIQQQTGNGKAQRVIAISSGKGGVGKTNLTINMAIALRSFGKEVVVFDGDLGLGNVDVMLGLRPMYTTEHLILGQMRFKDILLEGPEGIKIIPASSGITELTQLDGASKLRLIDEFDDFNEDVDYLLIDTGAGISNNVLFFCSSAHEVIVVVTSEPTSLTDAYALMKVLAMNYNERRFKIIINSAKSSAEAFGTFKRLALAIDKFLNISLDYLGFVLEDKAVKAAVQARQAFIKLFPNSAASKNLYGICEKLYHCEDIEAKGNIQFFFKKLLNMNKYQIKGG
jgi:flagellar biosynthesis protein FlhG